MHRSYTVCPARHDAALSSDLLQAALTTSHVGRVGSRRSTGYLARVKSHSAAKEIRKDPWGSFQSAGARGFCGPF